MPWDVIVIGAGAAGLAAAARLDQAGLRVICLEARDRIGGRIFTYLDPLCPTPIELGAEFVHGSPPETIAIAERTGLPLCDVGSTMATLRDGQWVDGSRDDGMWELLDRLNDYDGPDESWATFVHRTEASGEAKRAATAYVEGFNAAYADQISIASIRQDAQAAAAIDHGHQSRILGGGYAQIAHALAQQLTDPSNSLRLKHVVESVAWRPGSVSIGVRGFRNPLQARAVVITLPIGVLQHGDVPFSPIPDVLTNAVPHIANGQVMRVTFQFRTRFWEQIEGLRDARLLFSSDERFPTWWTSLPVRAPLLTGWSAGPHAAPLLGRTAEQVAAEALDALHRITGVDARALLRSWHFHDWQADPFARGAYSYARAGHLDARRQLTDPVENTLFFAGEATETEGHSATVHGAIATGERAARQVLAALR